MKRITYSLLTVLASLVMVSPLYARSNFTEQARGTTFYQNTELQHNNTTGITSTPVRSTTSEQGLTRTESAAELLGLPVVAQDGSNIGKIQDMRVDSHAGRIDYVIVKKENAMGVGEDQHVAVPLGALQITDENARLLVDKSKLNNVPRQQNIGFEQYREDLNAHYGIAPSYQGEKIIRHEETTTVRP